jgi:hypothetical protein
MGFLKKLTRPISKVLDKIVPNEIKPALPFLSAAVPFLAPTAGIFGTMAGRAALSGGANILAQLSQEGSEGDFSGLSALLAAGTGALSAPGGGADPLNPVNEFGTKGVVSQPSAADFFSGKAAGMEPGFAKSGLGALEKSANYLSGVGETLRTNPFSMEGIKASIVPVTQGSMDLAVADARRTAKDLADEALNSLPEGASDADRALAIRQFMEAAGYFSEDEIVDTITAAGYADGGRVKLSKGGDPDFSGIKGAVVAVDENMRADRAGDFFRLREEAIMKGDDDKIKEIESDFFKEFGFVMPKMAKDGGRINLREGGVLGQLTNQANQITTLTQGPIGSFQPFARPLMAAGQMPVFPRLNQLEQEVNRAEGTLNRIRNRLGEEQRTLAGLAGFQPGIGLQQPINMNSLLRGPISALQQVANRDANDPVQMEAYKDGGRIGLANGGNGELPIDPFQALVDYYLDMGASQSEAEALATNDYEKGIDAPKKKAKGGMMDLGGKEMDLRKGGFVPIGKKERADDVPARLSKNEFVMTADAVRGAGGGDINKGAKRMYETMNKLEARA